MTRRIILTGDLLRPQEEAFKPAQTGNILWLHRLLRRPIAAATGLPVEALAWAPGAGSGGTPFDTPRFYGAAGATADVKGWIGLFDAEALPEDAAALLAAALDGAVAVIGFELPNVLKRALGAFGIPWVDLNIHPYRFCADLLFAVQTTHPDIAEALRAHHTDDAVFAPQADLLNAMTVKVPIDPPIEEETLVVGQTRVDRSLIAGGRLVDLRDVAAAFHDAVGTGRVLFKSHPYNPDGFGLHAIGLPLRRIRESGENAYVLMAQDSVRRVVGVSSSLVAEAAFFGKEGIFLGQPPFRIAPDRAAFGPGMHASVVDAWLSADFWRDLLAPVVAVTARDGFRPALPPNSLRNALRQFWGWEEMVLQLPVELATTRAAERRAE
jgi:hypothetical protein